MMKLPKIKQKEIDKRVFWIMLWFAFIWVVPAMIMSNETRLHILASLVFYIPSYSIFIWSWFYKPDGKLGIAEKIVDTLDFVWSCIYLYWHYAFVLGISFFLIWMYLNSIEKHLGFFSGNMIYLVIGILIPTIFGLGIRRGVRC